MPRVRTFPAFVAFLLCPAVAVAQMPPGSDPLPPPRPISPPLDVNLSDIGSAYRIGSAGPYGVTAQSPSPLLAPEPFALERPTTGPGWYANVTLGLVKPHLTNRVTSGTPLDPVFPAPVQLPFPALDWTLSPRFELGYRLADGCGDVRLGYRFLASSGTDGPLHSRLDLNMVDIDYVSPEWLVENLHGPLRDLRLVVGLRVAAAYFDSAGAAGPVTEARFSSHFAGLGPRMGVEWSHPLFAGPVDFYTRFEATGLLGRTRQDFALGVADGAGQVFGAARQGNPQSNGIAVLSTEAGFAWRADPHGRLRLVTGYQFERWWNFGRTDDSNAELTVQGVFVRAEWRY
jgi:hypothetical protein